MNRQGVRAVAGIVLAAGAAMAGAGEPVSYDEVLAWMRDHTGATGAELTAGEVIGADRIEVLKPYLAPAYFEQFAFPGTSVEIQATAVYRMHPMYLAASREHGPGTTLAADGSIDHYVAGQPFSTERILAATAADAGLMIAWDNIHRWQYYGYRNGNILMNLMQPAPDGQGGAEPEGFEGGGHSVRGISLVYHRVYLSHLAMLPAQDYRIDVDDSKTLYYKDYLELFAPFDVKDTRFVIERAIDPHAEDQVHTYLPTERRVRRLSAKERADRFLGSEFTLDDFEGFSGRVLDYDWTYLGEKRVLNVADMREPRPRLFGEVSQLPNDRWQVRHCFVVEQRPRWEGHPYGRKVLFIDTETFIVALALVFDHDGGLFKTIGNAYQWPVEGNAAEPPLEASYPRWQTTQLFDLRTRGATVTRATVDNEFPEITAAQIRRVFSVSNLTSGR